MPADTAQANQGLKEWEWYPNQFWHLNQSMGHSCQKDWESTTENGQQAKPSQTQDSQINLLGLIQGNSKPQDLRQSTLINASNGSATKDQSGWGIT